MTAKSATTIHCSNKFADLILAEYTFLCLAIKKIKPVTNILCIWVRTKPVLKSFDTKMWRAGFQDNATKLWSFL